MHHTHMHGKPKVRSTHKFYFGRLASGQAVPVAEPVRQISIVQFGEYLAGLGQRRIWLIGWILEDSLRRSDLIEGG